MSLLTARSVIIDGGGGGGAPVDAEYVVMALNGTLTVERVLTAGLGIAIVDGGAGGLVTLSISMPIETIVGVTTLDSSHYSVMCDATGGAFSVNLPAAGTCEGRVYNIKKIDVSVNAITVDADGGELIDGVITQSISGQYDSMQIQSDGTEWWIL